MAAALMQQARKAIREGRLVEARSLLRQVIHEEPQNHAAWLLLARATPDKKLASQYIDRARQLQPDSPLVQRAQDDLASNKTAATNKFSYGWLLAPILAGIFLLLILAGMNSREEPSQQIVLNSLESVDRVAAAAVEITPKEPTRAFITKQKNFSNEEIDSLESVPSAVPQSSFEIEALAEPREKQRTDAEPIFNSDSDRETLPAAILMGIETENTSSQTSATSEEAYPISTRLAGNVTVEEANSKPSSKDETSDSNDGPNASDLEENADSVVANTEATNDTTKNVDQETQDLEALQSEVIDEDSAADSGPDPSERWIDVNLTTQTLTAYEGETPVLNSLISSGMWQFPTVTGEFHTWMKYESQDMSGYHLGYNYDLPDVPHVMYFFKDYAIHGAYWHNNFGTPMSHGCVNVNLVDAEWLYNWAPLGTLVNVHY